MATTIKLKNSVTTTNTPTSLAQGEVAINITDKKVWVGNAATTPIQLLGAGGSATFGALTCTSLTNSGLTSGRVTYATTAGLLTDSANFTFNGTTVTMANDASISGLTVGKGANAVSQNTAFGGGVLASGSLSGNNNTGVGYLALSGNTSGTDNTSTGRIALLSNTTGSSNSAFGSGALYLNTTGGSNNAFGQSALFSNTTAFYNAAFGNGALSANTTGASNTGIGYQALGSNTTASNNTAVGYQAIYNNATGSRVTALGYQAGYSTTVSSANAFNTYVGFQAGYYDTTGTYNTYLGTSAGPQVATSSGSYNTAIGSYSLINNTTASNNTAVGYQALYTNSTAGLNVAIGFQAGYTANRTADVYANNAFIGPYAGFGTTTGQCNTFVGAATTSGYGAGHLVTTGSKNTILGAYNGNQGGLDIRTASNYIVLSDGDGNPRAHWNASGVLRTYANLTDGDAFQVRNSTATRPYGIYVLFDATTPNNTTQYFFSGADTTNDKVYIYSSGTISNRTGTYNTISDQKIKQDIVDAGSQWDDIKAVRFRKYRLIDDVKANPDAPYLLGVVAQELEQTSPNLIDNCEDKNGEVTKGVKTSVLLMKAAKALQEAMERIETLEAKVQQLENK